MNPFRNKKLANTIDETGAVNPKMDKFSKSRMFDKKGSLNASSKKEAFQHIQTLLSDKNVAEAKSSSYRKAATLSTGDARQVLLNAFNDSTGVGMRKIGSELLAPIKNVLDYEGWARKILRIKPLAQGEVHRIAKDVSVVSFVVGQDGQSIPSQAVGKYVFPKEFKITAFPEVDIQDILQMNFDVLERQQDLAKQMIMLQEDKGLVNALNAAATAVNDLTYFGPTFNLGAFEDLRYQVERHRLIVDKFLISRAEVSGLLKNMHSLVDPVTERELILMGYIGTIFSTSIVASAGVGLQEVIPAGTMYAVTEGSFLGEMGIRQDLISTPYDKLNQAATVRGWCFMEVIDQTVVNPRAVAKAVSI